VGGTSLERAAGRPVDGEDLLESLLGALVRQRGLLDDPAGRRELAERWRASCVTLGRAVQVQLAGETFEGTAADLTDDGLLVVTGPGGLERTVAAGDVVHLRPPGQPEGGQRSQ
jgi:BirA family biotin operon repressor/biotin-[acetyl-CoA-carboxylase] ligase